MVRGTLNEKILGKGTIGNRDATLHRSYTQMNWWLGSSISKTLTIPTQLITSERREWKSFLQYVKVKEPTVFLFWGDVNSDHLAMISASPFLEHHRLSSNTLYKYVGYIVLFKGDLWAYSPLNLKSITVRTWRPEFPAIHGCFPCTSPDLVGSWFYFSG